MQTATFFSPASAALLRGLLSFADPPALAALEATSGLFGGGAPSLVELAVRDALGAAGLPQGLADARLAGESWAQLLRVWDARAGRGVLQCHGRIAVLTTGRAVRC